MRPGVNGRIAEWFRPLADEVFTDDLENLYARVGAHGSGPRVIVCAHQDEIGLVVSKIEDDGSLRIFKNGGVDPRHPPRHGGQRGRRLPARSMASSAPSRRSLLTEKDREKALKLEDLYVDVGYAPRTCAPACAWATWWSCSRPLCALPTGLQWPARPWTTAPA